MTLVKKILATSAVALLLMSGVALADSASESTTQTNTDSSISAPVPGSTSVQHSESSQDSAGVRTDRQQAYRSDGMGSSEEHKSKSVQTPGGSESHSVDRSQSPDGSTTTTHSSSSSTGG